MSTQSTLLTSCGSQRCSLEELLEIPEPQQTDTYTPLNYYDFALNTLTIASDLLRGFQFVGDQYALSANGQQMFGLINYQESSNNEMYLSIGIQSSYNKTLANSLVIGSSVVVCDNLMFRSSEGIKVSRKHTGNLHEDLNDQIVAAIYKSQHQYSQLNEEAKAMRSVPMEQREGFKYLGILTGENILRPTQSSTAFREAQEPSYDAFSEDKLWRYYNAATEALKSSPPQEIVQRYSRLHQLTQTLYLN